MMFPTLEKPKSVPKVTMPLLDALRGRRSRRFGMGMGMKDGPLAYRSTHPPMPLSEEEEALLAFAACGITGYALADLTYAKGGGGTIMARWLGRTIASGDCIQNVGLIITNDEATYLIKRPQDYAPEEIPELVTLAEAGEYVELYRRARIQIKSERTAPSLEPLINLDVNRWSLYAPGSTYLLPINELTFMYINGVTEILSETTGAFIVDERNSFRPAGLGRFARSKGGHLDDNPNNGKVATIQMVESLVTEFITIEMGMLLQNVGLMVQAMGLGGFPHWAAHQFGWLEALGFQMAKMPASKYLGMSPLLAKAANLLGKDTSAPYATGLVQNGRPLFTPYCPPYYPNMEAAVRAVVAVKFGANGSFRGGVKNSAWRKPERVADAAPAPSETTIQATIAYFNYVFNRYGRIPVYSPPFRTVLGYQATHVDPDFYDRFYHPDALTEAQHEHHTKWHGREL